MSDHLNQGHGHVFPRPDGVRARCGGPALCTACSADLARARPALDPEQVARWFHEAYERLAPQFQYSTRTASAKPWDEVPEANRNLMIATVTEVLARMATSR